MAIVTLTTDFGLDDYYVAAVKGVILGIAPQTTLIDVSHLIEPGDVEQAGRVLAAAVPAFPPTTVHLAVVDPGVGSDRRILAVSRGNTRFVAPDNGLLTPFLDSAAEVRSVEREDLFRPGHGSTFHGRDRFAPVTAHLAAGLAPAELGPAIDDPVRLAVEPPRRDGNVLHGRIVHVDHFGNLITDVPSTWLPDGPVTARVGARSTSLRADYYQQIPTDQPALLPGSRGTLELSVNNDSLARRWRVERGATVVIEVG